MAVHADPLMCWNDERFLRYSSAILIEYLYECAEIELGVPNRTNPETLQKASKWVKLHEPNPSGGVPEGCKCGCPVHMPERWPIDWVEFANNQNIVYENMRVKLDAEIEQDKDFPRSKECFVKV